MKSAGCAKFMEKDAGCAKWMDEDAVCAKSVDEERFHRKDSDLPDGRGWRVCRVTWLNM